MDFEAQIQKLTQLNDYYRLVKYLVIDKQDPVTGLIPRGDTKHAWVRDNINGVLCVWGLALAYSKIEFDQGRAYELKQSVVKLMRRLLFCMMKQSNKVERFKYTQSLSDSLHAKYNSENCETIVGDNEWGHLQIDATSLFLLVLAQMTVSGLKIIYTLDEVDFIQNLVFYIERAYRTPDFGVWERGNKINNGQPELNSSSIGLVTAALEALNGLDLFGARGHKKSIIRVLPDEISRNQSTLQSFLPRESDSKEIDSSILFVIGFPAFAIEDEEVRDKCMEKLNSKLQGNYGYKRFQLDGYLTGFENTTRLHYEPHELKIFKNIECEWPLFSIYAILNSIFNGDIDSAIDYRSKVELLLIQHDISPGVTARVVPEMYTVPIDCVDEERKNPGSQERIPNGRIPFLWAQSLLILSDLLLHNLITPGEIDPLSRRLKHLKENKDPVVQIVLISEEEELQATLSQFGLETVTAEHLQPVKIYTSNVLCKLYTSLGENKKMNLSGRPPRPIGSLGTCKVYRVKGQYVVFTPVFMEPQKFYLTMDNDIIVGLFKDELQFIKHNWHLHGRPTMSIMLTKAMFNAPSRNNRRNLLNLMVSLKSGVCNRVRVRLGSLKDLIKTSCVEDLDFLSASSTYDQLISSSSSPSIEFLTLEASESKRDLLVSRAERMTKAMSFINSADEAKMLSFLESKSSNLLEIKQLEEEKEMELCVQKLKESQNAYEQIDILEHIVSLKGLDFEIEGLAKVERLVEEVYSKASKAQLWSVTRQAAALLQKNVDSLTAALVDVLIRQIKIVFRSLENLVIIDSPVSPSKLHSLIFNHFRTDIREASLVQEMLIYLGCFIRAEPQIFAGILRLNFDYLINALKLQVVREEKVTLLDASERLFHLSPSTIKRMFYDIFASRDLELETMEVNFEELKKGYPPFEPENYAESFNSETGAIEITNEIAPKRKTVEIVAQSAAFLDGNYARVLIDDQVVFEMDRRGIGVVIIDKEEAVVTETWTFDTHYSKEESYALADYITSQKTDSIIAFVVKDEASENLTDQAKTACELLGSLRIREMSYRSSWAMISGTKVPVESFHQPREGPINDVKISLIIWDTTETEFLKPSFGKWLHKRHIDGGLNLVDEEFYNHVYTVLQKVEEGIMIDGEILPRYPTIADMTPGERNFALKVQSWLDIISNPLDRELVFECLMVLGELFQRNPEKRLGEIIYISEIVEKAVNLCWTAFQPNVEYDRYNNIAREFFYDLPMKGENGTLSFLTKAILVLFPLKPESIQKSFVED